jgi:AhpD family alkylhydroperoxidase
MLASMAALSPMMAIGFSHSERAVITVVVMLAMRIGGCIACHEAIAARAGVSVSTVKRALAKARLRGLLDRRERRRPGRPSLTNVVRIRDRELRERTQRRMEWRARSPNLNVHGTTGFKKGSQANKDRCNLPLAVTTSNGFLGGTQIRADLK